MRWQRRLLQPVHTLGPQHRCLQCWQPRELCRRRISQRRLLAPAHVSGRDASERWLLGPVGLGSCHRASRQRPAWPGRLRNCIVGEHGYPIPEHAGPVQRCPSRADPSSRQRALAFALAAISLADGGVAGAAGPCDAVAPTVRVAVRADDAVGKYIGGTADVAGGGAGEQPSARSIRRICPACGRLAVCRAVRPVRRERLERAHVLRRLLHLPGCGRFDESVHAGGHRRQPAQHCGDCPQRRDREPSAPSQRFCCLHSSSLGGRPHGTGAGRVCGWFGEAPCTQHPEHLRRRRAASRRPCHASG
mmetsp:Transcript_6020/g.19297  ORF Transcript_6020/g.19297 Transcript_6020/m.19297 type:complete len:304 (+) Transcript_6020:1802-2713(+)